MKTRFQLTIRILVIVYIYVLILFYCRLFGQYKHRTKIWYRLMVDTYLHTLMNIFKFAYLSYIYAIFLTHFLNFGHSHIVAVCTVPHFRSVCKNRFVLQYCACR